MRTKVKKKKLYDYETEIVQASRNRNPDKVWPVVRRILRKLVIDALVLDAKLAGWNIKDYPTASRRAKTVVKDLIPNPMDRVIGGRTK